MNESCTICEAEIGPSTQYPWHLASEDCRAVREPVERCEWFALCENPAVARIAHPAFSPQGVPTCQRCIDKLGLS